MQLLAELDDVLGVPRVSAWVWGAREQWSFDPEDGFEMVLVGAWMNFSAHPEVLRLKESQVERGPLGGTAGVDAGLGKVGCRLGQRQLWLLLAGF